MKTQKFSFAAVATSLLLSVNIDAQSPATGTINGHDYVDLGLSVMWATCNLGASSPSQYGDYYAWGEAETKSEYTKENSATYGKDNFTFHDAAAEKWGGSWRMPTKAECEELINNSTCTWTIIAGHKGCKLTSEKNGNSIFLPAAGLRDEELFALADTMGNYWSSSSSDKSYFLHYKDKPRVEIKNGLAHSLAFFVDDAPGLDTSLRYGGSPIRPVTE